MTAIAPHITAFLRERLPVQRGASEHTCQRYAYAFQLLFHYVSERYNVTPSELELEQLDAPMIMDFLEQIETKRGNTASTRNARLAAIKSFMRFCEYREPASLEQSRSILAIPFKRTDVPLIDHLSVAERQAILNAPDLQGREGLRDRAMLHLCFSAGLPVSERVGLPLAAVELQSSPSIRIRGKGRRERCLPLWKQTATDLRAWLAVRGDVLVPELFFNARDQPMTRSGFEYLLRKHVRTATARCPSLKDKRVSPHVLRHYLPFLTISSRVTLP